jgi:hypothetical protein
MRSSSASTFIAESKRLWPDSLLYANFTATLGRTVNFEPGFGFIPSLASVVLMLLLAQIVGYNEYIKPTFSEQI